MCHILNLMQDICLFVCLFIYTVFCPYVCKYITCAQDLWKLKEGVRHPGIRVRLLALMQMLGTKPGASVRATSTLK